MASGAGDFERRGGSGTGPREDTPVLADDATGAGHRRQVPRKRRLARPRTAPPPGDRVELLDDLGIDRYRAFLVAVASFPADEGSERARREAVERFTTYHLAALRAFFDHPLRFQAV